VSPPAAVCQLWSSGSTLATLALVTLRALRPAICHLPYFQSKNLYDTAPEQRARHKPQGCNLLDRPALPKHLPRSCGVLCVCMYDIDRKYATRVWHVLGGTAGRGPRRPRGKTSIPSLFECKHTTLDVFVVRYGTRTQSGKQTTYWLRHQCDGVGGGFEWESWCSEMGLNNIVIRLRVQRMGGWKSRPAKYKESLFFKQRVADKDEFSGAWSFVQCHRSGCGVDVGCDVLRLLFLGYSYLPASARFYRSVVLSVLVFCYGVRGLSAARRRDASGSRYGSHATPICRKELIDTRRLQVFDDSFCTTIGNYEWANGNWQGRFALSLIFAWQAVNCLLRIRCVGGAAPPHSRWICILRSSCRRSSDALWWYRAGWNFYSPARRL